MTLVLARREIQQLLDVGECMDALRTAHVAFSSGGAFSGDWARRRSAWRLQNGWNFWYMDHRSIDGFPVDLVRFSDGILQSYSDAMAAANSK